MTDKRNMAAADATGQYGFLHHVGRAGVWVVPVLCLIAAGALLISVFRDVRETRGCYYGDGEAIWREALDARPRLTLWSHSDPWSGPVVSNFTESGPHFTPDDGHALVASQAAGRLDTELCLTDWDGRSWGAPLPLDGANSESNEFEGVISPDGRFLYLTSDRRGGSGAADIWVASRGVSNRWEAIAPLGGTANTAADERGLSLSPDGRLLYFASERGGQTGGHDLFRARLEWPLVEGMACGQTSAAPTVVDVERLDGISSGADDVDPAMSPSGDLLYFSSNRRGGHGGYDLYVSRVIRGVIQEPENAGEELNGAGDERWPALRMQGFDMAYATAVGSNALRVVSVTRREVVGRVDYARWQSYTALLARIKWWVAAIAGSLIALIYLIRRYRDLSDRFHKCLMASAILHAAILFAVAMWTVSREIQSSTSAALEMMVDKVAIQDMQKEIETRKEAMKLDQTGQTVPLPAEAMPQMVSEQVREQIDLEEFTPAVDDRAGEGGMTVAASPRSTEQSVVEAVPVPAGQRDVLPAIQVSGQLKALENELQLTDVNDVAMEEPPAGSASPTAAGEVKLDTALAQKTVSGEFRQSGPVETKAVGETPSGSEIVRALAESGSATPVRDVGGVASATRTAAATRPGGPGEVLAFRQPTGYELPVDGFEMEAPAYGQSRPGATNAPGGGATAWGSGVSGSFDPGGGVAKAGSSFQSGGGLGDSGISEGAPARRGTGVDDVVGGTAAIARDAESAVGRIGREHTAMMGGDFQGSTLQRLPAGAVEGESMDAILTAFAKRGGVRPGDLRLGMPIELDAPAEYAARRVPDLIVFAGRPTLELVEALGGSGETEVAIRGSLEWLTRNQEPDGRWACQKHGGEAGHDVAATAMALLCYYGWGMKHNVDCEYLKPVKSGMAWLLGQIKPDGDIRGGNGNNGMYDQGIAGMALCEAYGISRDPALLLPSSNVVAFIARAQNKEGGWRYQPNSQDVDMSVFGWQFMALHSARMSGIPCPSNALDRAIAWLDRVSGGQSGGIYGYQGPNEPSRPAMSACGMFCRQLQKIPPTDARMKETAGFLRTHALPGSNVDFYYLYYTTLALYQHQGEVWEEWNKRVKEVLPLLQRKTGSEAGSWDPQGQYGGQMGRCVSTAMGALSLEVYYRFLPMYGYRNAEDEGRKGQEKGKEGRRHDR